MELLSFLRLTVHFESGDEVSLSWFGLASGSAVKMEYAYREAREELEPQQESGVAGATATSITSDSLQRQFQLEAAKIQRWKVSTQMNIDAKVNQARKWEALLEKQKSHLDVLQKHKDSLEDKLREKCEELERASNGLSAEANKNCILELGVGKLNATLDKQEAALSGVTAATKKYKEELNRLDCRLKTAESSHRDICRAKESELNEKLETAVGVAQDLKEEIFALKEKLSRETTKADEITRQLEASHEEEKKVLEKVHNLEEVIDCKNREIDTVKDVHVTEVTVLQKELQMLNNQLTQANCRKDELEIVRQELAKKCSILGRQLESKASEVEIADEKIKTMTSRIKAQDEAMAKEKEVADNVANQLSKVIEEKKDLASSSALEISKLQEEVKGAYEEAKTKGRDIVLLNKQKSDLELEVQESKRIHTKLKQLQEDFEKAILDVQVREQEIQKLRQFQVQKQEQDEENRKLRNEVHSLQEQLTSNALEKEAKGTELAAAKAACDVAQKYKAEVEGKLAELQNQMGDRDKTIESLKAVILEKEAEYERNLDVHSGMADDLEKQYKRFLDDRDKEIDLLKTEVSSLKATKKKMAVELEARKTLSEPGRGEVSSSEVQPRKPSAYSRNESKSKMVPEGKTKKSIFNLFSSSDTESNATDKEDGDKAKNSGKKFFKSRAKRSLEEAFDYDSAVSKMRDAPKSYKKRRSVFFSKR